MPENIGIFVGIMLFDLPETLIEWQFLSSTFLLHLFQDDILAFGRKDAVAA
jgi:hypothetical protein